MACEVRWSYRPAADVSRFVPSQLLAGLSGGVLVALAA
jgi:hypothetical protein